MKEHKNTSPEKSQSQSEKFKAMAKELGADGDQDAFDEKLKKLVRQPTTMK